MTLNEVEGHFCCLKHNEGTRIEAAAAAAPTLLVLIAISKAETSMKPEMSQETVKRRRQPMMNPIPAEGDEAEWAECIGPYQNSSSPISISDWTSGNISHRPIWNSGVDWQLGPSG